MICLDNKKPAFFKAGKSHNSVFTGELVKICHASCGCYNDGRDDNLLEYCAGNQAENGNVQSNNSQNDEDDKGDDPAGCPFV